MTMGAAGKTARLLIVSIICADARPHHAVSRQGFTMTSHSIDRKGRQLDRDFSRRRFLAGMGAISAIPWLYEQTEGRTSAQIPVRRRSILAGRRLGRPDEHRVCALDPARPASRSNPRAAWAANGSR